MRLIASNLLSFFLPLHSFIHSWAVSCPAVFFWELEKNKKIVQHKKKEEENNKIQRRIADVQYKTLHRPLLRCQLAAAPAADG